MEDYDELQDSPDLLESLRKSFAAQSAAPPPVVAQETKPFAGPPAPDQISTSSAAPAQAPADKIDFDPSKYMVTKDDLDRAAEKKQNIALLGAMSDNLSNRQSFGNFFTGHMQPKNDSSALVKASEDMADQPIAEKHALMKQEMQKPDLEQVKQAFSPTSEISEIGRIGNKMLLSQYRAILADKSPQFASYADALMGRLDGMSYIQMQKALEPIEKMVGPQVVAEAKLEAAKAQRDQMQGNKDRDYALREGKAGAGAVSKVTSDTTLKNAQTRVEGGNRMLGYIDAMRRGDFKDTPQFLAELNAENSALITGASNSALGKQERTEFDTSRAHLANIMQKISADPQSIHSPEIIGQLEAQIKSNRAHWVDFYKRQKSTVVGGQKAAFSGNKRITGALDATDQAADENLSPPDQPSERVKVSNGKETLSIPRSRIKDAEADKYFEVKE